MLSWSLWAWWSYQNMICKWRKFSFDRWIMLSLSLWAYRSYQNSVPFWKTFWFSFLLWTYWEKQLFPKDSKWSTWCALHNNVFFVLVTKKEFCCGKWPRALSWYATTWLWPKLWPWLRHRLYWWPWLYWWPRLTWHKRAQCNKLRLTLSWSLDKLYALSYLTFNGQALCRMLSHLRYKPYPLTV